MTLITLNLSNSLEPERSYYAHQINKAVACVIQRINDFGFELAEDLLLREAYIFADRDELKDFLSAHFKTSRENIIPTFSGTVDQTTLMLASREIYHENYAKLYSEYKWDDSSYLELIVHEIAHRAHAIIAMNAYATEDGMGPRWFYEGFAIYCAGQFFKKSPPFYSHDELENLIYSDQQNVLNYPIYGRMFHSLAASFPIRYLILNAGKSEFTEEILSEFLPSHFVFEQPIANPKNAVIFMVHGSAPFNFDGRVPLISNDRIYSRDSFYKDLSESFLKQGFSVLRYSKPGVTDDSIDFERYSQTDVALICKQLNNLWRFIPIGIRKIVFAWSEGSLHLMSLPLHEISAVILLGAISTNISDAVFHQTGLTKNQMISQFSNQPRTEMIGIDRPVGRLLDELELIDNWIPFAQFPHLPILILHGALDKEVPVEQSRIWRSRLPSHRIDVVIEQDGDHRLMHSGEYNYSIASTHIQNWLNHLVEKPGNSP